MRMKRYGKAVTLCLVFVLTLTLAASAAVPAPTARFFVNDYANVLTEETEQQIYEAGVQLYDKTKAQAVVVTVDSLEGAALEEYTLTLAREWGIGNAADDSGVLLFLAVQDRQVRIEVGYGLEGALPDGKTGRILDLYALPYFQGDDFDNGIKDSYHAIVNEVYLEYGMEADPQYQPVDSMEEDTASPFTIIAWLVMLVLILITTSRRGIRVLPLFFGHHHHHGGFGGGFRGGGGGFSGGGGGFGGGGSSRGF